MNLLEEEIKQIIIDSLNLEGISILDIKSEDHLFGEGLGLDSIDALEIGVALKKKYKVKIQTQDSDVNEHFFSVKTIANYVQSQMSE